jgi:hypothetical protein
MWKNLVHTQSNSNTIARWSSITFFLIHPVYCKGTDRRLLYFGNISDIYKDILINLHKNHSLKKSKFVEKLWGEGGSTLHFRS